jgi:hypothetical protein
VAENIRLKHFLAFTWEGGVMKIEEMISAVQQSLGVEVDGRRI